MVLGALVSAPGCLSNHSAQEDLVNVVEVEAVSQLSECSAWLQNQTLVYFPEKDGWEKALQHLPPNWAARLSSSDNVWRPRIVYAGRFPTAGYSLELSTNQEPLILHSASLNTLELTIAVVKPSRDKLVAQILSRPCIVMTVNDEGPGFDRIVVMDSQGKQLAETGL